MTTRTWEKIFAELERLTDGGSWVIEWNAYRTHNVTTVNEAADAGFTLAEEFATPLEFSRAISENRLMTLCWSRAPQKSHTLSAPDANSLRSHVSRFLDRQILMNPTRDS